MKHSFFPAALANRWLMAAMLALCNAPALVAAQVERPSAPGLDNPLNRNPLNRRGLSDSAPAALDPRNSTTRPTLPAAPPEPDIRDAAPPEPDGSRDIAPPAVEPGTVPVPATGTTVLKPPAG